MRASGARGVRTAGLAVTIVASAMAIVAGQGRGAPPTPPVPPAAGQPQQPTRDIQRAPVVGTGSITGTVVVEGGGTPVRRARVTLSGTELRGGRTAITGDDGTFSFASLPAGRFTMTAAKAGFVDIAYGAKRPGRPGTPIQLVDGQKLEKANISLPRGSVVTGIVIDENGEPSPGTQVRVMRYVMRTGEKTLQQAGQDTTDDRGMYRIYGLQPGEYIVSAAPRNLGLGDLRQTMMAEIEALMQQAQAVGAARPGGPGAGGQGGGGRGGRAGGGLGAVTIEPGVAGQMLGGGRGQALLDRATALQQQLQQTEQEQNVAYAPVYYPGTTAPSSASSVTLAIGDERSGVDFQLQLVRTASIQGTVVGPDGNAVQETRISLIPADNANMPLIPGVSSNLARVDREGRFTFSNVTPGQYRIMARAALRPTDPNAPPAQRGGGRGEFQGPGGRGGPQMPQQILWTSADVSVSGQNVANVALTLQPGMTVSGRVTFEGTGLAVAPTDLTRVRVSLVPRGQQQGGFEIGGVPPAQVDATGRFTITGVVPGRYNINATSPSGEGGRGAGPAAPGAPPAGQWVMKSVVAGGRDVLDFGLIVEPNQEVGGAVVNFTDRTQEVSGTIQDATGKPTADYSIVIYPSDNRYWLPQARRIQSVRPGTDGKFTFRGLPAGEYRLTAVTDVEPGEWYNADFLSQLVNASIPVTLIDGEKKTQDIRVR